MTMAIFIIEEKTKSHDLLARILYIKNPNSSPYGLTIAEYVSPLYPYDEMMWAKYCHLIEKNNTLNCRQYYEFVVSLYEAESDNIEQFLFCVEDLTKFIANFEGSHFQTLACIHTNTDNLHVHIIANNIDFCTGKRFYISRPVFDRIKGGVNNIIQSHGFERIIKWQYPDDE